MCKAKLNLPKGSTTKKKLANMTLDAAFAQEEMKIWEIIVTIWFLDLEHLYSVICHGLMS